MVAMARSVLIEAGVVIAHLLYSAQALDVEYLFP
jgi:hypothetical protein